MTSDSDAPDSPYCKVFCEIAGQTVGQAYKCPLHSASGCLPSLRPLIIYISGPPGRVHRMAAVPVNARDQPCAVEKKQAIAGYHQGTVRSAYAIKRNMHLHHRSRRAHDQPWLRETSSFFFCRRLIVLRRDFATSRPSALELPAAVSEVRSRAERSPSARYVELCGCRVFRDVDTWGVEVFSVSELEVVLSETESAGEEMALIRNLELLGRADLGVDTGRTGGFSTPLLLPASGSGAISGEMLFLIR